MNWGIQRIPSLRNIGYLLKTHDAFKGCPVAQAILDRARVSHGRDHLFDWPSKLGVVVTKTENADLGFVVRGLYDAMMRMKNKDPYSHDQLDGRCGAVVLMQWYRRYVTFLVKTYHAVFRKLAETSASAEGPAAAAASASAPAAATARKESFVQKVQRVLVDPLSFYEIAEGPDRDVTFFTSMPDLAMRMLSLNIKDIYSGELDPEIKGALAHTFVDRFHPARFFGV